MKICRLSRGNITGLNVQSACVIESSAKVFIALMIQRFLVFQQSLIDLLTELSIINQMTWIDIIIIVIVLALLIHGIIIGLIRGFFDIIGIILGYIVAVFYSATIGIPRLLAFLLIFIVVVVIVSIIGRIISRLIHITPLGFVDRILGGILGVLKGFVICFVFLLVLLIIKKENVTLYRSEIAPWIVRGGLVMSQTLPRKWYQWIRDLATKRELVHHYEDNNLPF